MSGVGKTTLANKLPRQSWFHYSGDYRIGTRYMGEPIVDNIKAHAMKDPFLANLLRTDSIYIGSNITFNNLDPLSTFLGQLGDANKGGLPLDEFRRRQNLHRYAEISAMLDVGEFQHKAQDLYGYPHFLNDAGGSLVEVIDFNNPHDPVLRHLCENTLLLHIKASKKDRDTLCKRAEARPKPMYFNDAFLEKALPQFMTETGETNPDNFDPDTFTRWSFPKMIEYRRPLYNQIGDKFGYTVSSRQISKVRDEQDFRELIAKTIEKSA